jgi:hypothetical protein
MGATISSNASAVDPGIAGKGYVHPEVLVSTNWLAEHLDIPTSESSRATKMFCSTTRGTSQARRKWTGIRT